MKEEIQHQLDLLEDQHNVRILYACESGSRAWGFESVDSDWDVRFIYAHPTEWYLTVQDKRDVIERKVDDLLDISGWGLKKSLQLLRKSNLALGEWLTSPIVYRQDQQFVREVQPLLQQFYNPKSCWYHYLHMAENNWRKYLEKEDGQVWLKKYLYVLRPVLACMWIEQQRGPVPTEFDQLDVVLGSSDHGQQLKTEIWQLVQKKRAGEELGKGELYPHLHEFLRYELQVRLLGQLEPQLGTARSRDSQLLDQLFVRTLRRLDSPVAGCVDG